MKQTLFIGIIVTFDDILLFCSQFILQIAAIVKGAEWISMMALGNLNHMPTYCQDMFFMEAHGFLVSTNSQVVFMQDDGVTARLLRHFPISDILDDDHTLRDAGMRQNREPRIRFMRACRSGSLVRVSKKISWFASKT